MKTKMKILAVMIFAAAVLLSEASEALACKKGSGNIVKKELEVKNFNRIVLKGNGNLYISQGSKNSLTVEIDDDLVDDVVLDYSGTTILLDLKRNVCPDNVNYYVTVVNFEGAQLKGSGDIIGTGKITGKNVNIKLYGTGDIKMDLDADGLAVMIYGSGNAEIKGKANKAYLEIKGSGSIRNQELEAKKSRVDISGSGNCNITVSEELEVSIFGSGNVYYSGNPSKIEKKVLGSGRVRQK